ncbi:hypothetical protein [Quatrionicoccus australiensis]|uniref:hypothetical protein n=1 Tax=Quatrionicoccus australiensis TaxID=138118 RepID=UPI001CFBA7EE|nr:hypothetical protein [Quatrionicoccus australiensis]MCB4362046.1 hypothetical protein [Quatrionicoccus australiensis]
MHFESWKWTGKQILREFWIHLLTTPAWKAYALWGKTSSMALSGNLRTVSKLVGAGMDRIADGLYVNLLKPMELVARANIDRHGRYETSRTLRRTSRFLSGTECPVQNIT